MPLNEVVKRASDGFQVKVPDLAEATGRSRDALYRAIHRGELRAIWLGRTPMIPATEALRLLGVNEQKAA